ncbi:MAG TPA: hypothetical protein V6D48_22775 [Oculatellaceae cyanobacterium]
MADKKKGGRFANLARQARGEEEIPAPQPTQEPQIEVEQENLTKKRGRPSGRRSDPNYTQISAYIPLDLLHEVQELLLQERKLKRLRSGVDVSGLVEKLLTDWVKQQRGD